MGGAYYQTRCSQDMRRRAQSESRERKIFLSIREKRKTMPREEERTERKRED